MIKKLLIPAAGKGTRFYPASRYIPKEMFPIHNKPLIQHLVETYVNEGFTDIYIVLNNDKQCIKQHFDYCQSENIFPKNIQFYYIEQKSPKGLGDAILTAKNHIGDNAFCVALPDEFLISGKTNLIQNLLYIYKLHHRSCIALQSVKSDLIDQYGIAIINNNIITHVVEKPIVGSIHSTLSIIGRYVFTPDIFFHIEEHSKSKYEKELQLTPAISSLIKTSSVYSLKYDGNRFDCGSPNGYLNANIHFKKSKKTLINTC